MELQPHELEEFERVFQIFVRETTRGITAKEIGIVANALGRDVTEQQLQSIINESDVNGNGYLDFPDFVRALLIRLDGKPDDDDIREAFRVFDRNGTGYIGNEELRMVLINLGDVVNEDEVEDMIKIGDDDGDGRLSYEEFCSMMTTQ